VHIPLQVVYQLAVVQDHERGKVHMTMLSHLRGRKFKNEFLPKVKGFNSWQILALGLPILMSSLSKNLDDSIR
jgi:hypothetical protein